MYLGKTIFFNIRAGQKRPSFGVVTGISGRPGNLRVKVGGAKMFRDVMFTQILEMK